MHRLAIRLAVLALAAGTVGGCGMFTDSSSDSAPRTADTGSTMAPDIESNVRQVQLLRTQGDMVGATRIISQLMLVYPDDPRVVGEYGKLLVQQKATADAIQFLRRAIQLQPNDWTFYSALGVAFDQQSNVAEAKVAYEQALQLKPGEPAVLNNYAMSRMMAGDTAGARSLLLAAQASGSTDPRIAANLALLDRTAPLPPAAPARAVAAAAAPGLTAPATPRPVTRAAMPPVADASAAPRPLNNGRVVMQAVPVDPLAGPVAKKTASAKPVKVAKKPKPGKAVASVPHPVPKVAATETKAKPAKKQPADHIPSLRMTADAARP